MNYSKKITKNVIANYLGYVVNFVVGFLLAPFIIHRLGDASYGIWAILGQLTGYLGILDLGIAQANKIYVAKYNAQNSPEEINKILSTSFFFYIIPGSLALLLGIVLSFFVDRIFNIPVELKKQAQIVLIIVSFDLFLNFIFRVFRGALQGFQRYDIDNIIQVTSTLLKAPLVLLFLNYHYGLIKLSLIIFSLHIVEFILSIIFLKKTVFPKIAIKFKFFEKEKIKILFNYSFFVFINLIAMRLILYTDNLIIGFFLPIEMVTLYVIGWKLVSYTRQLNSLMVFTFSPTVTEMKANRDYEYIRKLMVKGSKVSVLLTYPIGLFLIFFGKDLISLWVGAQYIESYKYMIILLIPDLIFISFSTGVSILYGIEKHKFYAFTTTMTAIMNFLISVYLVQKIGLTGVALGTAIPVIFFNCIITPIYILKTIKLPFARYFVESWLKPLSTLILFSLFLFFLKKITTFHNLFQLIITFIGCIFLYTVIAIHLALESDEKNRIHEALVYFKSYFVKI